ncbi:hypothetical protein [Acidithiobacillus sp.]
MSGRKVTPVKKIVMAKRLREHFQESATEQNAGKFASFPIPEPLTIGQEFDQSWGERMPLTIPPQRTMDEAGRFVEVPMDDTDSWRFVCDNFAATSRNHNGMVALVEGLRALAINPEIIAGEESGAFISGLLEAVDGSYPGELLALLPSVASALKGSRKHAKTDAVKVPILMKCQAYNEEHPTHGNTKIAKEMKRYAFDLNDKKGCPFK